MTTIIGLKSNDALYLGADKRITNGSEIIEASCSKIFKRPDWNMAIGVCGAFRLINVLKHEKIDFAIGKTDDQTMYNFSLSLAEALDALDMMSYDNGVKTLELGHIGVIYHNELYSLDLMLSVLHYNSKFFSIGSGSSFAIGALTVLEKRKMSPERLIQLALLAANRWDIQTDSAVEILRLEKK